MRQSLGRPPSISEFWDRAHTPKDSTMSPAVLAIRDRFHASWDQCVAELQAARGDFETLDSTVPLPEIELSRDEELALWVATQDPPTNNTSRYRVLGLLRIPTYTLLGGSSQCQRPRGSIGPYHTCAGLDNEIFQRVMATVSETFRTDPVIRRQELPSRARLHQLAQDIAAGTTVDSTGIPQEQFVAIGDEVLRLVVTLLSEAFGPIRSQPVAYSSILFTFTYLICMLLN